MKNVNHSLIEHERSLFEENFILCGGRLDFLKWTACPQSVGTYEINWSAIDGDIRTIGEELQIHANMVTSCFIAWFERAKLAIEHEDKQPSAKIVRNICDLIKFKS